MILSIKSPVTNVEMNSQTNTTSPPCFASSFIFMFKFFILLSRYLEEYRRISLYHKMSFKINSVSKYNLCFLFFLFMNVTFLATFLFYQLLLINIVLRSYFLSAPFQECTSKLWCTKRRSLDFSGYITFIPSDKHPWLYFLRYRFYAIFTIKSGNNVIDCTSSYIQHRRNVCVRFSFRVVKNHK